MTEQANDEFDKAVVVSQVPCETPKQAKLTRLIPYKRAKSRVYLTKSHHNLKSTNDGFIVPLISHAKDEEIDKLCDMLEAAHLGEETEVNPADYEYFIFCKKKKDGSARKPRTCKYYIEVLLHNGEILRFRNIPEMSEYTGINHDYIFDNINKDNTIDIKDKVPRIRIFKRGELFIVISFRKIEMDLGLKKALETFEGLFVQV